MTHQDIAGNLLAIYCGLQGAATIAFDLNRTHAAHPQWLGHARFHVVWQTATVAALSVFEIALLRMGGPMPAPRFYLAAILAAMPVFGFFAALVTRGLYGGTLSDPNGIPPWILRRGNATVRIDLNLVAELAGAATLAILVALYRFSP
ncbi:MAG TPA: hypothetical protein VG225_15865 [Terracidiphilus sp.]|nr:hypothetical protein [Terracidiphilus sp.]